jgi:hypothetical protein
MAKMLQISRPVAENLARMKYATAFWKVKISGLLGWD